MSKEKTEQQRLDEKLGDLTLLQAKQLADYLSSVHGVIPAGGDIDVRIFGSKPGEPKTEFDVVLTSSGDRKIEVIKVVRSITGLGLKEAKDLVETVPKPVKVAAPREEAERIRRELEAAGGQVVVEGDLIPEARVSASSPSGAAWTEAENSRRIELLVLRANRRLDDAQAQELDELQERCAAFLDTYAPLPFDKLSQLENRLNRVEDDNAP